MRLIWSTGTNANTELVPRMNIAAMIGAAISVARPIVRSASFVSPASTATYSNPLSAPIGHLAEHVEAEERERRHCDGERVIVGERAARHVHERQRDQHEKSEHQHHAARVVQPLAHAESDARRASSGARSCTTFSSMMKVLFAREPRSAGPDDIRQVRSDHAGRSSRSTPPRTSRDSTPP